MAELFVAPVPAGDLYIIYDIKERRGWWAGEGRYSIWPGGARIYTATEVDRLLSKSGDYIAVFTLSELEASCDILQVEATQAHERLEGRANS